MGDPPPNHPGVHPPAYKPPKWDGRRKAPRDEAEKWSREQRRKTQQEEAAARLAQERQFSARRQAIQLLKTIPFQKRRFLATMAEWEAGGSVGDAPVSESERPDWAEGLHRLVGSWAQLAEIARVVPYHDRDNHAKYEGPAW